MDFLAPEESDNSPDSVQNLGIIQLPLSSSLLLPDTAQDSRQEINNNKNINSFVNPHTENGLKSETGSKARKSGKRKRVSLAVKHEWIKRLKNGEKQVALAKEFQVSRPMVTAAWRDRDRIEGFVRSEGDKSRLSIGFNGMVGEGILDSMIVEWVEAQDVEVTSSDLRAKAKELADYLLTRTDGPELSEKARNRLKTFKASSGWVDKFCERNRIKNEKGMKDGVRIWSMNENRSEEREQGLDRLLPTLDGQCRLQKVMTSLDTVEVELNAAAQSEFLNHEDFAGFGSVLGAIRGVLRRHLNS